MKTIIKLSLFTIVVLFASCATTDISIVKRKYNNGYYVDVNTHKKVNATSSEKKEVAANKITTEKQTVANNAVDLSSATNSSFFENAEKTINEPVLTASASKKAQTSLTRTTAKSVQNNSTPLSYNNTKAPLKTTVSAFNQIKKAATSKKGQTDDQTILLVILSLFPILALIAVYIKDGKKITTNFWVDLILHITLIGYAIFALLVVLDIFSLA